LKLATKGEAEKAIRQLCHHWRRTEGYTHTPEADLNFSAFYDWVARNHGSRLEFKTTSDVRYNVQMWFDQEFRRT
jgi:hypothetical protein